MAALFRWPVRARWGGHEIGDARTVTKLLLLPKCLGNEWRWLGFERVIQRHETWKTVSPGSPCPFSVRGWRDKAWADKVAV